MFVEYSLANDTWWCFNETLFRTPQFKTIDFEFESGSNLSLGATFNSDVAPWPYFRGLIRLNNSTQFLDSPLK